MPPRKPSAPKTRISDIAERLGLSTATVSRALSGDGYVRADRAAEIQRVAREMNYKGPRALTGQTLLLVASEQAMLDFHRNQFTMYVVEGLRRQADAMSCALETFTLSAQRSPDENMHHLSARIAAEAITGVLLLTVDDALIAAARSLSCPVVLVNGDDPAMAISSVSPCNRSAAALATRHLRELGHEQILFLTHPGRRTIRRRLEGWQDIMGSLAAADHVIEAEDWTSEAAADAVSDVLRAGPPFTAIVAAADVLAAGAIKALSDQRVSVPGAVSVIGIDGLPQGDFLSVPLTSVTIPMAQVGQMAVSLLGEIVQDARLSAVKPARKIELACALTLRSSTGPAPAPQS